MAFHIGPDFTDDDVKVERKDRTLSISASYDAEIGVYGAEVYGRQRLMSILNKKPTIRWG